MKKLIPAIAMLLVCFTLLGTSTFAWFSMNGDAYATGLTVIADAPESLLIKTDGEYASSAVFSHSTSFGTMSAEIDPVTYLIYNIDQIKFYKLTEFGTTLVKENGTLTGNTGYKTTDGSAFDGTPYYTVKTGSELSTTDDNDYKVVTVYKAGKTYYKKVGTTYTAKTINNAVDFGRASTLYTVKPNTGVFFVADVYDEAYKNSYYKTNVLNDSNKISGITDDASFASARTANGGTIYFYVDPVFLVANEYNAANNGKYYAYDETTKAIILNSAIDTQEEYDAATKVYIPNEKPVESVLYYRVTSDVTVEAGKTYSARITSSGEFVEINHSTFDNDTLISDYAKKYYSYISGAESTNNGGVNRLVVYEVKQLFQATTTDVFYDEFSLRADGETDPNAVLKVKASYVGEIPALAAAAMHVLIIDKNTYDVYDVEVSAGSVTIDNFVTAGTDYAMYYFMDGNDADCKNANLAADAHMNIKLTFSYTAN